MADLILRSTKGTGLTNDEIDANFVSLNDNKVEVVAGKSLVSDTEIAKLATVEANANAYVHPATHPSSIIEQTASARFVTDTQISTWNGKQDTLSSGNPLPITSVSVGGVALSGVNTANGLVQLDVNGAIPTTVNPPKVIVNTVIDLNVLAQDFGKSIITVSASAEVNLPTITADTIGKELIVVKTSLGFVQVNAPANTRIGASRIGGSLTFTNKFSNVDFIRIIPVTTSLYIVDGYGDIQFDVDLMS